MNAKEFIDSLFKGYEETPALADFKEELLTNMNAKIENFIRKGMDMDTAFAKASAELGDVSSLADELSLKKRKEVFEEVYMDIKMYMPAKRVAGYVVFGTLVLWGITSALIALFSGKNTDFLSDKSLARFFGAMLPFLTAAVAGFTWLGVTQETASMNPVSKKRGTWYAIAAGLIFFGLLSMLITYFKMKPAKSIIGEIIPFILPGIGILAFLILTEKDRLKPWAKNFRDKTVAREMALWNDPAVAVRFGLFSGAIWMFAVGIFVLLGFFIGFKFSWLVFIFATAFQLLVQGVMSKRGNC
jgi:hypothetical protein